MAINIKMGIKEIEREWFYWLWLAQKRIQEPVFIHRNYLPVFCLWIFWLTAQVPLKLNFSFLREINYDKTTRCCIRFCWSPTGKRQNSFQGAS